MLVQSAVMWPSLVSFEGVGVGWLGVGLVYVRRWVGEWEIVVKRKGCTEYLYVMRSLLFE